MRSNGGQKNGKMVRPVDPNRAAVRRQQILDAAVACFRDRGFQQTNMAEICAAASMSPGALYRYFPSKDSIICSIIEQHVTSNLNAIYEEMGSLAALRAFAREMLCDTDDRNAMRLKAEIFAEAGRRPEFLRQLFQVRSSGERALSLIIANAQGQGEWRADVHPDFVARNLVCLLDGLVFRAMTSGADAASAEESVDFFENAAIALLAGPGTPMPRPGAASEATTPLGVNA